jgi:rod shape-determining protein MreD
MLLWSAAMIGMDVIEMRFPWRSYVLEWAVGAAFILGYLLLAGGIAHVGANTSGGGPLLAALVPQLIFSVLLFPLIERFVALCDKARLWRFRDIS